MRELSVYFCPKCGRYGYFQLAKNAICPICHASMNPLKINYQDFMNLDYHERDVLISSLLIKNSPSYVQHLIASDNASNQRQIMGELLDRIDELENENMKLNDTISWMHDTIWELLRKNKALFKKLH